VASAVLAMAEGLSPPGPVGDEPSPYELEIVSDAHDRATFRCGNEALDRYFREIATQDIRRRVANCFVAAERTTREVAGFYTLASSGIPNAELPADIAKRLPRYATIPVIQLGHLAVDLRYRGRGLGSALLADAAFRSARADPAAFTLIVDATDDAAAAFYRKHGLTAFASRPLTLFLPIASALKLFS
jgi:ribosomal protein S18 acetylase RimI-like enzyme